MKYEIKRFNNNEVIKHYYKNNNSILIVYLDNHIKEIPYSEDNERKILNEMIIQALAREENEFNTLPYELKCNFANLFSNFICSIFMSSSLAANPSVYVDKPIIFKFIYCIILSFSSANIVKYLSEIIFDRQKVRDIIKYHEFFELKEELDKYGDVQIDEATTLKDVININTLDFYTIDKIEEILNLVKEDSIGKIRIKNIKK